MANYMLELQQRSCSNINLVTPTHSIAPIAAAVESAKKDGLTLPIVYNTGGYDSVETLKLLDGLIDIYMPDMKYSDPKVSKELSQAQDYPQVNFAAVKEMHHQVGDLDVKGGLARKGLLVRHLVLPNGLAGSEAIINFLADEISASTTINVMGQYRPCYKGCSHSQLNRHPSRQEIDSAREYAVKKGLQVIP
jgi:putative pyruvate formate lyase activating enzyme